MNVNEIDFNKLHLAAKPIQIIVALVLAAFIVGASYLFVFKDQLETWDTAKQREETLKTEYETLSTQVANLENLEQELVLIEESISKLIKQLPTQAEIPDLLNELHLAATNNRLIIGYMTPRKAAKEDDNIERLPFAISVTGTYDQISKFVRDVGRMSRIVTLSSITITPEITLDDWVKAFKDDSIKSLFKKKGEQKLQLNAIASTYKAIDTPPPAASAASGVAKANTQK